MEKEFLIQDVFETQPFRKTVQVPTGATVPASRLTPGHTPRITATNSNNGIGGYYKDIDDKKYRCFENCISVSFLGNVFHHPYRASFDMKIHCLKPINHELKSQEAQFLIPLIRKEMLGNNYFNQTSSTDLPKMVISLPVIPHSDPTHVYTPSDIDWPYMERYIVELEKECIAALDKHLAAMGLDDCKLTPEEEEAIAAHPCYAEFSVGEVFVQVKPKCKKKGFDKKKDTSHSPNSEFCIPLINAKLGDNGIMYFGRECDWDTQSMCIDVVQNGQISTGKVYAQPQPTGVLGDAYLLKPVREDMCEEILIYLAVCLEKITRPRFSYDDKAYWSQVRNCKLSLPVVPYPNPNYVYTPKDIDWKYMEQYIRATEKLAISDIVKAREMSSVAFCI